MKISIIGAGKVGATLAKRIMESDLADVVLLDVLKTLAEGKALDLLHAAPIVGYQKKIIGTDDYLETKNSDIVVITAGFSRQPGMSRADLTARNGNIVKEIVNNIKKESSNAIIIVVTNPLDMMTYIAYKVSGFNRNCVMGMAGVLDSSRFAHILARELNVPHKEVETIVLGQHGPEMIPIISHTKVSGRPVAELINEEKIDRLKKDLRESGSKIVSLLGKGSAYYAPSAAIFLMVKAIVSNEKRLMSVSCLAEGEYGLSNVCIGLPVKLGKNGIEEIVRLDLDENELSALKRSAEIFKGSIPKL